jgi:hypothetical protein
MPHQRQESRRSSVSAREVTTFPGLRPMHRPALGPLAPVDRSRTVQVRLRTDAHAITPSNRGPSPSNQVSAGDERHFLPGVPT